MCVFFYRLQAKNQNDSEKTTKTIIHMISMCGWMSINNNVHSIVDRHHFAFHWWFVGDQFGIKSSLSHSLVIAKETNHRKRMFKFFGFMVGRGGVDGGRLNKCKGGVRYVWCICDDLSIYNTIKSNVRWKCADQACPSHQTFTS